MKRVGTPAGWSLAVLLAGIGAVGTPVAAGQSPSPDTGQEAPPVRWTLAASANGSLPERNAALEIEELLAHGG